MLWPGFFVRFGGYKERKRRIPSTCRLTMAWEPSADSRKATSSRLSMKRFSVRTAGQEVCRRM